MELAALPFPPPAPFGRALLPRRPPLPIPAAATQLWPSRRRKAAAPFRTLAYVATPSGVSTQAETAAVRERRKHDLLRAVQDTQRGFASTPDQRSAIEEALVCVEGYGAGEAVELDKLDGTWRLVYTSASDVLILFEAANTLPFLQEMLGFCVGGANLPEIRVPGSV